MITEKYSIYLSSARLEEGVLGNFIADLALLVYAFVKKIFDTGGKFDINVELMRISLQFVTGIKKVIFSFLRIASHSFGLLNKISFPSWTKKLLHD